MIYPQKINSKKTDKIIMSLAIVSVILGILFIVINRLTSRDVPWAALTNSGIIYVWITVIYSIKKNTNIAGHVLIQTIAITLLTIYIDYRLGFNKWSLDIAMPIMIIISNVTMFVLTLVSYRKYIKYAVIQLIIVLLSMIPIYLISKGIVINSTLSVVAVSISIVNLIITIALSTKDIKEAVIRQFHV